MKKKGFTLVELLAVIAILAILVIIALPNVLSMFNQAKKNTFVTEAQSIFSAAETQFVSDAVQDMSKWNEGISYARINGERVDYLEGYYKLLDLSGNTNIDYYIHFNNAGQVTEYYVSDKQFQFIYFANGKPLSKEDIKSVDIGSDGKVEQGNEINHKIYFEQRGRTSSDFNINTGVITIADAISYCDDWIRLFFDIYVDEDTHNKYAIVDFYKYNKGEAVHSLD